MVIKITYYTRHSLTNLFQLPWKKFYFQSKRYICIPWKLTFIFIPKKHCVNPIMLVSESFVLSLLLQPHVGNYCNCCWSLLQPFDWSFLPLLLVIIATTCWSLLQLLLVTIATICWSFLQLLLVIIATPCLSWTRFHIKVYIVKHLV